MKFIYEMPEIRILRFETKDDVVTASGEGLIGGDNGGFTDQEF